MEGVYYTGKNAWCLKFWFKKNGTENSVLLEKGSQN